MEVEIWKRAQRENKDIQFVKDGYEKQVIRSGEQVTKISTVAETE